MKSERHGWQGETWVFVCAQVCVCVFCPSVHVQQNEGWLKGRARLRFSDISVFFGSSSRVLCSAGRVSVSLLQWPCEPRAGLSNHGTTDKEKVQEEKTGGRKSKPPASPA